MKLFSQREGFKPIKNVIQLRSMDQELHNSLWNAFYIHYLEDLTTQYIKDERDAYALLFSMWLHYFKQPIDQMPARSDDARDFIRKYFFSCNWFEVYDLMEFTVNNFPGVSVNKQFIEYSNLIMERELSGYRFIGETIAPVTSKEEVAEIEEALKYTGSLKTVSIHMKESLRLFSDRKSPDYRNSIKESISAVEAICGLITGKKKPTLGDALKVITEKIEMHTALQQAFIKLYGYTSDAEGIRHSLMAEPNLNSEDAKFMLVSCSAFINYLKVKASKAGIDLESK
ncbi:hypothetical protein ES703_120288 [subsurface metagenome]